MQLASWLLYLKELKYRLLRCLMFFMLCIGILFYCRIAYLQWLLTPLIDHLPSLHHFVLTSVSGALFFSIQMICDGALFLTVPYLIVEIWCFILPALYPHERRLGIMLLIFSQLFFFLGILFAYEWILPAMANYIVAVKPEAVTLMLDVQNTVHCIMQLFLIFGLCFQIPLICMVLVKSRCLSILRLKALRRYMIVSAFIVGMLLAPPDVFSQTLIALPLWGLFELGIWMSSLFVKEPVESQTSGP